MQPSRKLVEVGSDALKHMLDTECRGCANLGAVKGDTRENALAVCLINSDKRFWPPYLRCLQTIAKPRCILQLRPRRRLARRGYREAHSRRKLRQQILLLLSNHRRRRGAVPQSTTVTHATQHGYYCDVYLHSSLDHADRVRHNVLSKDCRQAAHQLRHIAMPFTRPRPPGYKILQHEVH